MLSPVTSERGGRILSVTQCCTVTDNRPGARQSLLRGTPSFRGGPPHCHSWHLCVDDRPAHLSLLSYLSLLFCFSSLKKRQDFPECFACLCFVMRNYQHLCCVSPASCEHHRSWLRSVGSGWLRLSDTLKLVNCYRSLDVMVFYESQKTLSTAHLMPVGSQTKAPVLPCAFKGAEWGGEGDLSFIKTVSPLISSVPPAA